MALLCAALEARRSCYYAHRQRCQHVDVKRLGLRSRVSELFRHSRAASGSRTLRDMMQQRGIAIGRLKVRRLMASWVW